MPDFNYGDFTQQGIENKVTLKARLNKRRYVTLDLQSDVEGPNLTISGNVHDELNNIDYPIGSAPNGNIEITENGENINVAPYATATVNVSGGGGVEMLHCVATIVNNTGENLRLRSEQTPVFSSGGNAIAYPTDLYSIADNRSVEIDALYQAAPNDMFGIALVNATAYEGKTLEATASNEVNCSLISMDAGSFGVILTNAENPSSITVTFTLINEE